VHNVPSVEGRVLVHGQDEESASYLMLEGTDARVYFVYYTPEIEAARCRGKLRTNSFVRLRKRKGTETLEIEDLGNAAKLLTNSVHMRQAAHDVLKRGIAPIENGWGGWLGQYHIRQLSLEPALRSCNAT
jgi:hypothetical protein